MAQCATCGNEYDKAFTVRTPGGTEHSFDSIECAAQVIAPTCAHCGCRILGHGVEAGDDLMFCCAACAQKSGVDGLRDRVHAGSR